MRRTDRQVARLRGDAAVLNSRQQDVDVDIQGAQTIRPLQLVKLLHTIVWAFFATSILAIPLLAWAGHYPHAGILIVIVLVEVIVLIANGWRCPLTSVAARFTDDRRDNFDIYLPAWLARHNKVLFGALYILGVAVTLVRWHPA